MSHASIGGGVRLLNRGRKKVNTGRKENFLIIIDGNNEVREVNINAFRRERISFGRDSSNQIVLNSSIASKVHGYFEFVNDALIVYDANSTNGLYINGKMFRTDARGETEIHKLRDGDIIRIDNGDTAHAHKMGVLMMYTTIRSTGSWKKIDVTNRQRITIGRNKQSDIWLDNVKISRQHAVITHNTSGYYIQDMNSSNGVFVNGQRVTGTHRLREKDIIFIANSILFFTSGILLYKSDIGGTRVVMQNVSRTVKVKGQDRRILTDVNLTVEPNEFIAIIGGSGAGKSTVMNAMSGFEQATEGAVFVNNVDLYKNYQVLKNIIGYVPQQDIIYENITLQKMLEYSAKMRMDEDVSSQERMRRIDEVLRMVELTEHRDKYIRSLSGGQKKRASIAVELLADPGLFFLDEPTSGLDPGTEAGLMRTLNSLSKQKGKTIVMVTHTTQNLHLCDKILFMGKGGKVCFYGPPAECMDFFGVDNLTEIYNKALLDKEVDFWAQKYIREYGAHKSNNINRNGNAGKGKKASFLRQFGILSSRYMNLIKNDTQRLLMIFLQPIIIAILIALVADEHVFEEYSSTRSILFAVSCAGIWVGLFNSIQEICKERNILKREYMANLRLGSYVLSKFAVQLMLSAIQAVIMMAMFFITVGTPEEGVITDSGFLEMILTMLLTIFSSSAIGLVVSSLSKNSDKAMTVAPFLLIIQLLFSGILFKLEAATEKISYLTVSRWSVSSFGSIANLNPMAEKIGMKAEDIYEFTVSNVYRSWLILLIFIVICFFASMLILRNVAKDSR